MCDVFSARTDEAIFITVGVGFSAMVWMSQFGRARSNTGVGLIFSVKGCSKDSDLTLRVSVVRCPLHRLDLATPSASDHRSGREPTATECSHADRARRLAGCATGILERMGTTAERWRDGSHDKISTVIWVHLCNSMSLVKNRSQPCSMAVARWRQSGTFNWKRDAARIRAAVSQTAAVSGRTSTFGLLKKA